MDKGSPLRERGMIQSKHVFSAVVKFLMILPRVVSHMFLIFLFSVLEFVLHLFCLCFPVLHYAGGGGGGRRSGFYFFGHQNTSDTSYPIGADCVSHRDQGL